MIGRAHFNKGPRGQVQGTHQGLGRQGSDPTERGMGRGGRRVVWVTRKKMATAGSAAVEEAPASKNKSFVANTPPKLGPKAPNSRPPVCLLVCFHAFCHFFFLLFMYTTPSIPSFKVTFQPMVHALAPPPPPFLLPVPPSNHQVQLHQGLFFFKVQLHQGLFTFQPMVHALSPGVQITSVQLLQGHLARRHALPQPRRAVGQDRGRARPFGHLIPGKGGVDVRRTWDRKREESMWGWVDCILPRYLPRR